MGVQGSLRMAEDSRVVVSSLADTVCPECRRGMVGKVVAEW